MGKRGPPCTLCVHPKLKEVRAKRAEGYPIAAVASHFRLSYAVVQKHFAEHEGAGVIEASPVKAKVLPPPPKAPDLPASASPRERAQAQCEFLDARMKWSVDNQASGKDIAALSGQITNATRLLARLSGSLEVTEAQIIRSVPWQRVMGAVIEALGAAGNRKLLEDIERRLATLAGENGS